MSEAGAIFLITGIMAAGKSTVAQALAERSPRSVHVRGDLFRRMIVQGQELITASNWPAAERQLHLRQDIAAGVARTYADHGFSVFYQDVIIGKDLERVISLLAPERYRVHVVVLAPDATVAGERDQHRAVIGYTEWTPAALDHMLRHDTPQIGLWLDTSTLSVDQTVETILDRMGEARIV